MPLWRTTVDNTSSAPLFSGACVNKTPNADIRDQLFNNSTPSGVVTGQVVSVVGVGAANIGPDYANSVGKPAHTGWILRRAGTGGRAGRVHQEVLVAGGFGTSNTSDQIIIIYSSPQSKSVAGPNGPTTFPANAVPYPNVLALSYRWQINSGSGFVNLATNAVYTNTTSNTLTIANVNALNLISYRMIVSCNNAVDQTSTNATLTVT